MTTTTQLVILAGVPSVFIAASAIHSHILSRRLGRKLDAMAADMESRSIALVKPDEDDSITALRR
jgi:hypothetical protein